MERSTKAQISYQSFFLFLSSVIICQLCKLILSVQTEVTLLLTASFSNLVLRFVVDLPLQSIKNFSLGFKPTLGHPVWVCVHNNSAVNNLSTSITNPRPLMQYIAKLVV